MENTKYISEGHIRGLAGICEQHLSKDIKKTLKRLEDKYKITFTFDKQTNVNLLWKAYSDELLLSNWRSMQTNRTYKQSYNQTNGINIECSDMLKIYIENTHKEDYSFIWDYNPQMFLNDLNQILRMAGGSGSNGQTFHYYNESLSELLNCNDYFQFFNAKFGISNVNAKALKATKNAIKTFDELLNGIPNKAIFFQSLAAYYQNNDLAELHNTIHTTD